MMRSHNRTASLAIVAVLLLTPVWGVAAEQEVEPLQGSEWRFLGMITGLRSVVHKKSGFVARILEADGSATVAQNPVSLFLVVTNNDPGKPVERAWRIPRGVTRVRRMIASRCGVDVEVDVDRIDDDGQVRGATRRTLQLCFLAGDAKLASKLKVKETSR